jgi:site-specific DNA-cytosine methylase
MNVLSLFDGMSCGQIALDNLGIKVDNYFASEIDKYAIQVAKKNYPNTKHIGDVTKVKGEDLPNIDLLIGGSPCQGFSFAGKQLNFEDERSKLFFEYVRLLKECNPKYFLLENVKMSKVSRDVITEHLGVEPIEINSSKFTAHNRPRIYWTNIPVEKFEDKGIVLTDILETDTEEVEQFKNCVRKNIVGVNVLDYLKPAGFAQVPCESGYQDHKIGITKSPCLRAGNSFTLGMCKSGGIRRLTPIEWERLQGVDDNYTAVVSNTQRYRMLGNGWTVPVIEHIFRGLKSK